MLYPYSYDMSTLLAETYHGGIPSSTRTVYYARHLLRKVMSVFKFTIPERWDLNYFLYTLFVRGFVCITDVPGRGICPQHCTINGWNMYYNPATALIDNPNVYEKRVFNKEVKLGVDGELISLTPDHCGIMDCVNEYAEMLANASAATNMNLYNSRLSYAFWAKNPAQAESFKKMYDEIGTGKPAVVLDKTLRHRDSKGDQVKPFEPFNTDLKANYIADKTLDDMVKIEQAFARNVGLPTTNTLKRERQTTDEVNKSDVDTRSNIILWEEMLNLGFERTNRMFYKVPGGLEEELSVELRFSESVQGGLEDVSMGNN